MSAIDDVRDERERQREKWSALHDDEHLTGELLWAAEACLSPRDKRWPWGEENDPRLRWGKRKRLVVAAALIVAEIERLDRKAQRGGGR